LAKFFCHKPDSGSKLRGGDRALFLSMLSTKESITLTAEKIPDEVIISLLVHLKMFLCCFSIEHFKIPDEVVISLLVNLKTGLKF
jgi:hypothetical protein